MEQFSSAFGIVELTGERLKHILEFHPEVRALRRYFPKIIAASEFIGH